MKIGWSVLFFVPWLSGCSGGNDYSESNMKLFAALYDFEPLKGEVREAHFSIRDETGESFQEIVIKLDPHGCLTSMDVEGTPVGAVSLKREGNRIAGTEDNKKVTFETDKNCIILNKKMDNGELVSSFSYDKNNTVVSVINGKPHKSYRYRYHPDGKEMVIDVIVSDAIVDKTKISYSDPVNKYLDYSARSDGPLLGESVTEMSCKYKNKTPERCDITYKFLDEGTTATLHMDIRATFYE
ncbi:hypothetical protein C3432_23130 [Citrobacter amalonaticus]|uniref:YnfC family lipoprotein n=1 Tax=Citrobacter amalonaticus TaxID=35703 RepID=A0A2S4S198_CITAM|nr:YnfC family lipoprotein [Citrobacter amalonaticus]POT55188.1 hypothetical protein C3432_23130 [Citrobacter amalonaticus]POT77204.1 hypothetical protein C3436_07165 [Citrobacter amalonaticus]POU67655.1 hypothetical protein C3430_00700 [Citrobacter amalonaticus]POV07260.1 hypothetical protein C3424_00710 [Citrobacter amalonaticus]